jgi:3-oxoacyl-[acyl-carrier protein] reductase
MEQDNRSKRVALITGGTRGIGFGIARCLAAEGFDCVLCGRRTANDVADSLEVLKESGNQTMYVQADIGIPDDRNRLIEEIKKEYGTLSVLVNNAGIAPRERCDILDAAEESFEEVMRVNLQGPYFLTQQVARWMTGQKQSNPAFNGCIIFVTSISSTVASVARGEYCISKAALSMASKLFAVRLSEFGINVYEIRPGIIKTDMTAGVQEKYDSLIAQGIVLQPRWGTPEDVGKAVAMLTRGDLPYSTGQIITVDGGMTVSRL